MCRGRFRSGFIDVNLNSMQGHSLTGAQWRALVLLVLSVTVAGCGNKKHQESNFETAVQKLQAKEPAELRRKAEQGDAIAQCDVGHKYAMGQSVPTDYVEAAKWLRKAAEQGYAP